MARLARVVITWLVVCCGAAAQPSLNLSEDLVRLRIDSSNMVPNDKDLDAGPLFRKGVNYAQAHHIPLVIADPGAYYFHTLQTSNAHVSWTYLTNLTIDLQGSDLYFTYPLQNGMFLARCTNIVLQNFTADYDPLPFTQVNITSVNPGGHQIQFAVDNGWQNPSVLNAVFPLASNGVEVHIFRNGKPIAGVPRMFAANPVGTTTFTIATDSGGNPSAAVLSLIRPGDVAFLGMRTQKSGPVSALYCNGCTFRNITAYSSAEWGISVGYAESNVFDHTYSIPRPGTDRLASTYGQLELAASGPGNQARFNRMIRTMDNSIAYGVNVLGTVQSQVDSRTFVVEGSVTSLLQFGGSVPDGAAVAFQRPTDGSILLSAVIASQMAPPYNGQQPYQATFTFDRDLPASIVGTVMFGTDPAQHGANALFEYNALEQEADCCRGFLIAGVSDTNIRGNYIQGAPMAALHIENALFSGFLSPPAADLTIAQNVIDHTNWTPTRFTTFQLGAIEVITDQSNFSPASATAHQNISVTNNFIADSGSAAVWLGNTNGGTVSGNYFLNANDNAAVESSAASYGPAQPLIVAASTNVTTSANTVDTTSLRMWVTDSSYRELAAYTPGSTIRLNAYELGDFFSPPVVTLIDAKGNAVPVTIQASTAHAIDVQLPASSAPGAAYLTLVSGSLKYFATLFLDGQDNIPALNGCTYEVSPASSNTGSDAGQLPILVITQDGCSYSLSTGDPFVLGSSGATGTSVVSVGFASNSGASRTTTIEIAGQPVPLTQETTGAARPLIQAIVDPWNYVSGLAPGEWVSIVGTTLAAGPPRIWNLSGTEALPTTLGNVTVSFNGAPAALLYVSATQINALVPATVTPGSVQVVVQSNGVSSSPFTITAAAAQPAIYALPGSDGTAFFVTAALAGTATLVGNSAVDPRVLRAAQPGDVLDLYMIGLGATEDASKFITDRVFAGAYPVTATVTASVGAESCPVSFAGLTSPGLYLVRITIPRDLSPGPQVIGISAGGVRTSSSLKLLLNPAP